MNDNKKSVSKFLSLILRHQPERIGLKLDSNGWVEIDTLLAALQLAGTSLDLEGLRQIVAESDKQRFRISDDGTRIRANQGHSVPVNLQLEERQPPDLLFHGTVAKFLDSIYQVGLRPGNRHHVHLSEQLETANQVGARRGKPVVLKVAAAEMFQRGIEFYLSENGVWLTNHVPVEFLSRLQDLQQG